MQSFTDDDLARRVFFGRNTEGKNLTIQIMANRLVVVFARSGIGKTSLLNAGIAERLRKQGHVPLGARVNDTREGPLKSVYDGIEQACRNQGFELVPGNRQTLWHYFKSAQFWSKDDVLLTPVLLLDQFEELFTLQTRAKRQGFVDQLAHLIRGVCPPGYVEQVTQAKTSDAGIALSEAPPVGHIVISLREDFLPSLEELSDSIPQILDCRFRLLPLSREAAQEAMEEPARVDDKAFDTQPFKFQKAASDDIMEFLTRAGVPGASRSKHEVEPFQLQLVCQHIEGLVRAKQQTSGEPVEITTQDIGGADSLSRLLAEFYESQLQALPGSTDHKQVRRLCGEYLISPSGRRLSVEESEIERLFGIHRKTLRILVDGRLLRADQRAESNYYELSHDSLIEPILMSRRYWFRLQGYLWRALAVILYIMGVSVAIPGVLLITTLLSQPAMILFIAAYLAVSVGMFLTGGIAFRRGTDMLQRSRPSGFRALAEARERAEQQAISPPLGLADPDGCVALLRKLKIEVEEIGADSWRIKGTVEEDGEVHGLAQLQSVSRLLLGQDESQPEVTCPNCNWTMRAGAAACPSCGADFGPNSAWKPI